MRHVLAHSQRPRIARLGRRQPDDSISRIVQLRAEFVTALEVLPDSIGRLVEKEAGVAGVLDVQVDLDGFDDTTAGALASSTASASNRVASTSALISWRNERLRSLAVFRGCRHGVASHRARQVRPPVAVDTGQLAQIATWL